MPRNSAPVSRFPREMMNALVEGARREIRIDLPTRKDCTVFRQKLYTLRAAMKREAHHNFRIAERAEVVIENTTSNLSPDAPHTLVIRPANVEYVGALRKAGITSDGEDFPLPPDTATATPHQEVDYKGILEQMADREENREDEK